MNSEQDDQSVLLGITSHVLSFTIAEFCKYGYLLAFEKELFDLKGLVKADSVYENDFEILQGLKDPAIKILLSSIDKVVKHIKVYLMINGLDEVALMMDPQSHHQASNTYHYYVNEGVGNDYSAILLETHELYFSVMHMIFHTAYQLDRGEIDLPDSLYDNFYFDFLDVLDRNLPTENKNVQLLYDLIVDINEDALKLSELT